MNDQDYYFKVNQGNGVKALYFHSLTGTLLKVNKLAIGAAYIRYERKVSDIETERHLYRLEGITLEEVHALKQAMLRGPRYVAAELLDWDVMDQVGSITMQDRREDPYAVLNQTG